MRAAFCLALMLVVPAAVVAMPAAEILDDASLAYLEAHGPMRVAVVDNGLPFGHAPDGRGQGIVYDALALMEVHSGVPIEAVHVASHTDAATMMAAGEVDAYGPTVDTGTGDYTAPFAWSRLGFWVLDQSSVATPQDLAKGRIAYLASDLLLSHLASAYPDAQLVPVAHSRDGLDALASGTVDGFYGGLADVGYLIRNGAVADLRQVGPPEQVFETRFAVAGVQAQTILDAALASVPASNMLAVYVKWTGLDLGEPTVEGLPTWTAYILLGSLGLLAMFVVGVVVLRQQVRHRTENLRAERDRMRSIMDNDPAGLIVLSRRGLLQYLNPRAAMLLGVDAKRVIGAPFAAPDWNIRAIDGSELSPAEDPFRAAIKGRRIRDQRVRVRGPTGKELPLAMNVAPLPGTQGRNGAVIAFEDLSVLDAYDEAERVAFVRRMEMARLEEMDRFKTDFINAAAHELNTPLTPVRIQLHMLQSSTLGDLNERQRRALFLLDRNFDRLGLLVGDMLDVARVQSGRLDIRRKDHDVAALVREAADIFRDQAELQGVSLDVDVPDSAHAFVDGPRFNQMVYNLLSNALKFTPEGGRVMVRSHEANDMLVLDVEDTGAGMDLAQIARLFRPFSRVHQGVPEAPPGTGLGLYITRALAELHGGTVGVASPGPGLGSTFTLSVPLQEAEAQTSSMVPESQRS